VKQWREKRQKWCDYVQRLPEDLIFIHVFKETPPATIFSRVGHKITSLSLIYLSHLRYAFHPYSAHVSSIHFSQVGRYLALYHPYTELYRGNASPCSSLGLKYTNIPPVLIAPRALRHGHIFLFLASTMVITANFLAVVLGGIFDRGLQPLKSDIMVTYPFTTSINTQIQRVNTSYSPTAGTFAKPSGEHWLLVNTNVVEGTNLPAWVTDEFYLLPFDWGPGNKSDLTTSITQGYGGNLRCQVLTGNTFQQCSKMDKNTKVGINVTMPLSG